MEKEYQIQENNSEYCTSCGKIIKKEAFVCPHCGVKNAKNNQGNEKNKFIAGLLAIFLGIYGIHKFYLKKPLEGILYILWFLVFTTLYIVCILFYEKIDPSSSIWYFLPHVPEWLALITLFFLSLLAALIAFIEGIILLCMNDNTFDEKYNK